MYVRFTEIILYVSSQEQSKNFYSRLLDKKPLLDVPGMTEFSLSDTCKLGLMPNHGIAKILAGKTPHPDQGNGIPRCELYLYVHNPDEAFLHAIKNGAKEISRPEDRDWGDRTGYVSDRDGHIIAFASRLK